MVIKFIYHRGYKQETLEKTWSQPYLVRIHLHALVLQSFCLYRKIKDLLHHTIRCADFLGYS